MARSDGAETAQTIGIPATAAFWTISKLTRPDTIRIRSWSGIALARTCEPTSLSSALCRPTSSRSAISSPFGVNRPAAWSPPVSSNARCAARSRSGQREDHRARDDRSVGQRVDAQGDLVDRGLAADPARRRRDEVALGDLRVVERARQPDADGVVGLAERGRVAAGGRDDLGAVDQALRPQEADGELVLVAGRAHRDRDRDRLLRGPAARISSGASPTTRSSRTSIESPRTATIWRLVMWRIGGASSGVGVMASG